MQEKIFWVAGVIVLIIFSGCISVNQPEPENTKPEIEITPEFYDFGDVPYEKITYTFLVKNKGNTVLEITGISTSCGCTKGTVDKKLINPGETTELLVTIDPDLMEEEVEGKIERIVYVKSNDKDNPEIEIELTANILE